LYCIIYYIILYQIFVLLRKTNYVIWKLYDEKNVKENYEKK